MALFKTFTVNLHCPDTVVTDEQMDAISDTLNLIPLADILKSVMEQKVAENEETKAMTVTVHED